MNLLDLPAELRIRIYELALIQNAPICINRSWQEPPLLSLGPDFPDFEVIYSTFYAENTFVYYLSAFHFDDPNFQALVDRIRFLGQYRRDCSRRVNVVCYWATKVATIEGVKGKVVDALRGEGVEVREDVFRFVHTDEVWKGTWFG